MIKATLLQLINPTLACSPYKIQLTALEKPKHNNQGDFASPICFSLAKTMKKPPQLIASEICHVLNNNPKLQPILEANALNGFINFKLKSQFLCNTLSKLNVKKPNFPKTKETILLEYVSANPTGPLHIGHGRWAVIGSVMAELLRYTGHQVTTEFYLNDAGNQINTFYESIAAIKKKQPIPKEGYHGNYIHQLAALDTDPLDTMIKMQQATLNRLNITFDHWFSEKTLYELVPETLERLKSTGWTYELDEALWFKAKKGGDEKDRVLVKADGSYTYFAVDAVYHDHKLKRGFSQLINIWGADHHGYVARINAVIQALSLTHASNPTQFIVIIGQLVSLMRNGEPIRMSKRTGDMIKLDDVINEIGVDATRFFLIEYRADTHLEFDLTLAKKKSADNPVYYLQYAHARICRILTQCNDKLPKSNSIQFSQLTDIEHQLILALIQWPDVAWAAATQHQPYQIATYCLKLAKLLHSFYEQCPIINSDHQTQQQRLTILIKFKAIFQQSLTILGISAPEKM